MARCGEVKVWHWAHVQREECDPWWEPETDWHRHWKSIVPADRVEVPMEGHRADIIGKDGVVIELQHSSISPEVIRTREAFYGRMVWLIDGQPFLDSFRVELGRDKTHRFEWANARPSWFAAGMPRFIHGFMVGRVSVQSIPGLRRTQRVWASLGPSFNLFQVLEMRGQRPVHGVGRIVEVDRFVAKMLV